MSASKYMVPSEYGNHRVQRNTDTTIQTLVLARKT